MKCTCQEQSACSSCRPSVVEKQEEVVRMLQDLLLKYGKAPTGQLKDMAVALGVAVDKLVLLRPPKAINRPHWNNQFYANSGTAVNHPPQKPENTC